MQIEEITADLVTYVTDIVLELVQHCNIANAEDLRVRQNDLLFVFFVFTGCFLTEKRRVSSATSYCVQVLR